MTQQFNVTESELKVIKSDLKRAKKDLAFLEEEKKKGKNSAASVREALSLAFAVARLCRRNARC